MFSAKIKEKIRQFFYSIRMRLTVLYLALLGLTLAVFCTVLLKLFVRNHQQEFDFALYNHAVDVAQSITVDFFGDFVFTPNALLAKEKVFPFSLGKSFAQVVSPEGQIVARSANLVEQSLPLPNEDWQALFRRGHVYRTLTPQDMESISSAVRGENYRQIVFMVRRGKPLFILQIAVPMTLLDREKKDLIEFFMIGIPVSLLFAGIAGFYLAGNALAPVRNLIKKAAKLNPANLSERLPEPTTEDEIRMLTITLNGLLGRIEKAFESQEHFISDASHQLKTPLAILRGELDVFRAKDRAPEEIHAFLESATQELEHLSRLVDDLLTLAKIDAGAGSLLLRKVRLDEILLETVARFELLAKKKNISIRFNLEDKTAGNDEHNFEIEGDSDLLQSMFRNLVDNAVKYSPENSSIEVELTNDREQITASIKDFGAPIPEDMKERLFQRFERGNLRVGGVNGTGLGLTIAKRIAEMHSGNILISQEKDHGKAFRVAMKKN
jgi:signal transduction histidine kinase